MSLYKYEICRLCLKICGTDCTKTDQMSAILLNALFSKPDMVIINNPVFCKNCANHLEKSVEFNKLIKKEPFIVIDSNKDCKDTAIVVEHDNVSTLEKICRFCMKAIEVDIRTTFVKTNSIFIFLQKYFSEMDLTSICEVCLDFLHNHLSFISKCLSTEQTLKKYIESECSHTEQVDLYQVLQFKLSNAYNVTFGSICKSENDTDKVEMYKSYQLYMEGNNVIVTEKDTTVDILVDTNFVVKEEVEEIDMVEGINEEGTTIKQEQVDVKCEEGEQERIEDVTSMHPPDQEIKLKQKPTQRPNRRRILRKNGLSLPIYKCDHCPFVTSGKASLNKHIKHKDATEVPMFQCPKCPFQTKYKGDVKRHSIVHDDSSEAMMYKCDHCAFQTKHKYGLKQHLVTHRTALTLKCPLCPYKAKMRHSLKVHMSWHNAASDGAGKIHQCEICFYCTTRKSDLKKHLTLHADQEVWYNCDACPFKTKYKSNFDTHLLRHKSSKDVKMYKCYHCAYQTIRKGTLKRHVLTHMDVSEVKLYQCGTCSFKTKSRSYLNQHTARLHGDVGLMEITS